MRWVCKVCVMRRPNVWSPYYINATGLSSGQGLSFLNTANTSSVPSLTMRSTWLALYLCGIAFANRLPIRNLLPRQIANSSAVNAAGQIILNFPPNENATSCSWPDFYYQMDNTTVNPWYNTVLQPSDNPKETLPLRGRNLHRSMTLGARGAGPLGGQSSQCNAVAFMIFEGFAQTIGNTATLPLDAQSSYILSFSSSNAVVTGIRAWYATTKDSTHFAIIAQASYNDFTDSFAVNTTKGINMHFELGFVAGGLPTNGLLALFKIA